MRTSRVVVAREVRRGRRARHVHKELPRNLGDLLASPLGSAGTAARRKESRGMGEEKSERPHGTAEAWELVP